MLPLTENPKLMNRRLILLLIICTNFTFVELNTFALASKNLPPSKAIVPDLVFGEKETLKMLSDRPIMKELISPKDDVFRWCCRRFGGESCGEKVYWNGEKNISARSQNQFPVPQRHIRGEIFLRETSLTGTRYTSSKLWEAAVYELINIGNFKEFEQITADTLEKGLSKEEYIRRFTELEYKALKEQENFKSNIWEPTLIKSNRYAEAEAWREIPPTYLDFTKRFVYPNYPWNVYGKFYDEKIAPLIKKGIRKIPTRQRVGGI